MDKDRWRRIEDLFHDALELPPAERPAYLDANCDDDELRREVSDLLAAEAGADETIDGAVSDALSLVTDEPVPEQIGPYRVLERLGEGGLATVYLAERSDEQYRMRVAIKVVKRGMDTAEVLRRLRVERQILAGLDHPNVARLLDGGSLENGRPYVVMEAIDGEPIDQHCNRHRLDLRQRLEMFRKVCSAVHAAHRSLVIHRDLKPSNILVTAEGEPKLLDFGIAKVLDPQRMEQTVARTLTGMRWLTPEYASPEQVRGEPLTTAADIYALGALLYELLCGRRPFVFETGAPREVERLVCETDPPRPSLRLFDEKEGELSAQQIAAHRQDTPDRLRRRLRGDLDTLVLAAMRKEPARRYPSAQALEDDVRRHLESRPLTARPDTAAYRVRKFVRRHRAGVIAASLVAISLVGGIIGTTRALLVAESERQRADEQRQRAERHLDEVQAVVDFNVQLFEIADPGEARGSEVTVLEVLDHAGDRIERELGDRPAVAARMLSTVGLVNQSLGLYDQAGKHLESAFELRREAFGEDSLEVARGAHELAGVRYAQRRFDEALVLYLDALARRRRLLGERHRDTAASLHGLALVREARGELDAAEELQRRSLELRRELLGEDNVETAQGVNDLGELVFYRERYDEAQLLFRRALEVRRERLGDDHPQVAETLHNLAAATTELGQPAEAEKLYREILALRRKLFPGPHRDLVKTLGNLALSISDQGPERVREAEAYLRQALEMAESIHEGDPLDVSRALRNLARNLGGQERYAEALPLAQRALDLVDSAFDDAHPDVGRARYFVAWLLAQLERPRQAIAMLDEHLRGQRQVAGLPAAQLAFPLALLADLQASVGRCELARRAMSEVEEVFPDVEKSRTLVARRESVRERCSQ